jgi:branched-chain amino acid transport system permease protein
MSAALQPPAAIDWRPTLRVGLIGGVVAVYLALAGLIGNFSTNVVIQGVISFGQTLLLGTFLATGFVAARRVAGSPAQRVRAAAAAGALAGAMLSLLIVVGAAVNLRAMFINASPALWNLLTFGLGTAGFWVPVVLGLVVGALASLWFILPPLYLQPVAWSLAALLGLGLFSGLLRSPLLTLFGGSLAALARLQFAPQGLTQLGALLTLVVVVGGILLWRWRAGSLRARVAALPPRQRQAGQAALAVLALAVVLLLPQTLGPFVAQVIALVALYVLMGLGLNITLGLAGLLDLGFVAFFAVGAYTVGLLTSTAEYGLAHWSWWAAAPFGVVFAMLFGAFLGLPILGIRGDYLAIATLGFGEIIRILAGSDLLKPWLGGPRGLLNIPKPIEVPPTNPLTGPNQIYYLALLCAALVAFVAVRLREARLGRTWMAIREDEDVAEALGVNLVQNKLLAYMLGAAFAGLSGAIFAGLVGSIFASSMQLFVSINVVALIIVGGMGSIPGVIVGAIFLIGLPELFREFSEYRYLFYGVALIVMMLQRPEGLLPAGVVRRELHATSGENVAAPDSSAADSAAVAQSAGS